MSGFTRFATILIVATAAAGCYHATIETALPPSPQTVEVLWAHGFLFGLVPPSTVATQATCPNGVSRVETRLSFVNQVANIITLGIYTPMHIRATCAAGGSAQTELRGVSFEEFVQRSVPVEERGAPHAEGPR